MSAGMRYKLLAMDIDGTLLTSRHTIGHRTRVAIKQAVERGIPITLATGRAYPSAKSIAAKLGLRLPLITHDGAFVADPAGDRVLFVKRIPVESVCQIVQILLDYETEIMILHESLCVTNRKIRWSELFPLINPAMLRSLLNSMYRIKITPSHKMCSYVRTYRLAPPKLFVMGKPEQLEPARRALQQAYANEVRVTTSGTGSLEILPAGVSKATGLTLLSEYLGIRLTDVVAVGDSFNDVEMLETAGLGVAMGNAPPEVKRAARLVTASNDEDGVGQLIRKLFLPGSEKGDMR